ncbi:MAG TPA: M20 family metallopeptidase [Vicinamibacterales bacterium]
MTQLYDLQKFCRAEREWQLDVVESLVRLESPTTDKAAVDRCGAELAQRLEAMGGRVTRLPRADRGDHLLAEYGCGESQVLLLGHFDTVWPVGQLAHMPLARSDGRLHGPGVFDMKAGIGIAMLATRALLETGASVPHRLVMLWTTDEEIGSASSRAAIEDEARRSAAVLVLEPSLPGGAVKTSRKGCGQYELVVRGLAAHAGIDPTKGASAIRELAHQIGQLYSLPTQPDGVSLNVGTIAGGSRPNVVADEARAVIDVRAATRDQMNTVDAMVRGRVPADARTHLEVTGGFDRPPLERTAGVARLYDQARAVARELGSELAEGSTGGGSDGNFTAAIGVPTLDGLGAVGDGAHARHEYVKIEALADRAALLAGLIARLE